MSMGNVGSNTRTAILQADEQGNLLVPLGKDGKPDYGLVMRHFRYAKGWTAEGLSDLYSEALQDGSEGEEPITARWILIMEQKNRVPVDEKRRWIIATLLNIPCSYFGLKVLNSLIPSQEEIKLIMPTLIEPVDITDYHIRLRRFWASPYSSDIMREVAGCIFNLQEELIYGETQRKEQITPLLCHYLFLYANLCRYRGYYTSAILYLNKLVHLAKEHAYHELHAKALYLRGYTFFDKWDVHQEGADLTYACNDFEAAQEVIGTALRCKQSICLPLQSALLSGQGLAQSYRAQDEQGRLKAIHTIDKGGILVDSRDFMLDDCFFRVNEEVYHLDKAEAFLSVGWHKSALRELTGLKSDDTHVRLRYVYRDILEAEAYVASGKLEMGVVYAEHALTVARQMMPIKHLARIINMHRMLQENKKYANSSEVARLGVKLFHVQHPEIFR